MSESSFEIDEINNLMTGFNFDYKWADPSKIVVAQWVRAKCMYGCSDYGNRSVCPPEVPAVAECERFFGEFKKMILFRFNGRFDSKKEQEGWLKAASKKLLEVERRVFLAGYYKAFMFLPDGCDLCSECASTRADCKMLNKARPSFEAFAVDVYETVRSVGYPIEVVKDMDCEVNRYGCLLIE